MEFASRFNNGLSNNILLQSPVTHQAIIFIYKLTGEEEIFYTFDYLHRFVHFD